ncbi:MAG: hypothetical protein AUH29_10030 [Candidatus Rokubacteria bacterium 13_1_40CM_69_27]|nr:MAG: hypothetical protein AUH29_10030 [Candidatus Rokubacteria bacterium 13_1_40CM_69_27]
MLFLIVVLLVGGYAVVASWAVRHGGQPRLGAVAAGALMLVALAALLAGHRYAVPSMPRLLLYALAFMGPIVLVPTVLLWRQAAIGATRNAMLGTALLGALAGLLCGWVLLVYGLGVW